MGVQIVRQVSWDELTIDDDRKYLEIVSTDHPAEAQRLDALCECGAQLTFVSAEAGYRSPETCCCGSCRTAFLMVVAACGGCGCDDCTQPGAEPCSLLNVEVGFSWEGEDCDLFLREAVRS